MEVSCWLKTLVLLFGYMGPRGGLLGRRQISRPLPAFEPRAFGPKPIYMTENFPPYIFFKTDIHFLDSVFRLKRIAV